MNQLAERVGFGGHAYRDPGKTTVVDRLLLNVIRAVWRFAANVDSAKGDVIRLGFVGSAVRTGYSERPVG